MDGIEETGQRPNTKRGGKHTLLLLVIWTLFTAVVLLLGFPIVQASILQSGVLSLVPSTASPSQGSLAKVWFFTWDGSIREFSQQQIKRGGSAYHDTFESLLAGPKLSALQEGALSSINAKTTLRGLTLSNKVLYIDLSRHFLESEDMQGAYEQLKRTARGFSQVKEIVLLIEGERATLAVEP